MLEIYNEQVRDLLVKTNPKGGLQVRLELFEFFVGLLCASMQVTNICQRFSPQVRQNPKEGNFFVQNLKRVAVVSYEDIERRIEEGKFNTTYKAMSVLLLPL